jgi:hypothetical protein
LINVTKVILGISKGFLIEVASFLETFLKKSRKNEFFAEAQDLESEING